MELLLASSSSASDSMLAPVDALLSANPPPRVVGRSGQIYHGQSLLGAPQIPQRNAFIWLRTAVCARAVVCTCSIQAFAHITSRRHLPRRMA